MYPCMSYQFLLLLLDLIFNYPIFLFIVFALYMHACQRLLMQVNDPVRVIHALYFFVTEYQLGDFGLCLVQTQELRLRLTQRHHCLFQLPGRVQFELGHCGFKRLDPECSLGSHILQLTMEQLSAVRKL